MKLLFQFLTFWVRISKQYNKLKENPQKQNSVTLGVTSILMSIFGVLTAVGFAYLAFLCFSVEGLSIILAFILGVVCVIAAIGCFFQLLVSSIFYAVYQLKLNKRPIGIVALVLSLLLFIGAIAGIVIVLLTL